MIERIENLNTTGTCWTYIINDKDLYAKVLMSYKTPMLISWAGQIYKFHESIKDFSHTTHVHCGKWGLGNSKSYDSLPMWDQGPISTPGHDFKSQGFGRIY